MPRTGRTPLPASQRKDHKILVRVSESELAQLQRAAGREPISTYVRRMALRAAASKRS